MVQKWLHACILVVDKCWVNFYFAYNLYHYHWLLRSMVMLQKKKERASTFLMSITILEANHTGSNIPDTMIRVHFVSVRFRVDR